MGAAPGMVANAGPISGPGWTGHSPDGPGRCSCPVRKARQDSDWEGPHSESLPAQQPEQHNREARQGSVLCPGLLGLAGLLGVYWNNYPTRGRSHGVTMATATEGESCDLAVEAGSHAATERARFTADVEHGIATTP